MITISDIAKNLKKYNSFLLFCHTLPDGDTLGGVSALKIALEKLGKTVKIAPINNFPNKYCNIFDFSSSYYSDNYYYDCCVAIDCATESKLGNNYNLYTKSTATFNIDHHISNTQFAKYNYIENVSSSCEIVYKLIIELSVELDDKIAYSLMVGITTDTGNFSYLSVSADTFLVASNLMKCGCNLYDINQKIFKLQSKARALLCASVINKIKFYLDDRLSIITVFNTDLIKCNATSDMTEGFIDYPLSIDCVKVAVSILESGKNTYKVSFRGRDDIDVNDIALTFGGGGHKNASGCVICGFYEDVVDKIIRAVSISLGD